jgi:hypothetical protein
VVHSIRATLAWGLLALAALSSPHAIADTFEGISSYAVVDGVGFNLDRPYGYSSRKTLSSDTSLAKVDADWFSPGWGVDYPEFGVLASTPYPMLYRGASSADFFDGRLRAFFEAKLDMDDSWVQTGLASWRYGRALASTDGIVTLLSSDPEEGSVATFIVITVGGWLGSSAGYRSELTVTPQSGRGTVVTGFKTGGTGTTEDIEPVSEIIAVQISGKHGDRFRIRQSLDVGASAAGQIEVSGNEFRQFADFYGTSVIDFRTSPGTLVVGEDGYLSGASVTAVPEPGSWLMLLVGAGTLVTRVLRRKAQLGH